MKMYGIKNCDTVKRTRAWLEGEGIAYDFHDYKKDGVDRDVLEQACKKYGWDVVLNMRGTTWRKLSDDEKAAIDNEKAAIELMMQQPSMIKRPILDTGEELLLGFNTDIYTQTLRNLESCA